MASHPYSSMENEEETATNGPVPHVLLPGPSQMSEKYKLLIYKLGKVEVYLVMLIIVLGTAIFITALYPPADLLCGPQFHCTSADFGMSLAVPAGAAVWTVIFLSISGWLGTKAKKYTARVEYKIGKYTSFLAGGVSLILVGVTVFVAVDNGRKYGGLMAVLVLQILTALVATVTCIVHHVFCHLGQRTAEAELVRAVFDDMVADVIRNANSQTMVELEDYRNKSNHDNV